MIIELEEYELPKGKKLLEKDSYTKTGIFLVNDGITIAIVSVHRLGDHPSVIHVPLDLLTQYFRQESSQETEKDIVGQMRGRLDEISDKLDDLLENKQIDSVPQIYTQEKIDGNTLLKAIALVQNPELAKDLLIEN